MKDQMARLQLELLGSPTVLLDGAPIEANARKPIALLIYLAVTGRPQSREFLGTLFWPEHDPAKARAYLRNALWVLSKAGLEEWLDSSSETIGLQNGLRIDITDFRSKAAAGMEHNHLDGQTCPDCLIHLRTAADLYRGSFLSGFTLRDSPAFDDWQTFQAEMLRQEFSAVLDLLLERCEALGDCQTGVAYARRWVAEDPFNEPAHRSLMRMYTRCSQRALALKQYETLSRLLDEELGAEPDLSSQQLYDTIVAGKFPLSDSKTPHRQVGQPVEAPSANTPHTTRISPGVLAPEGGSDPSLTSPPNNLPGQVTSFIGRHRDMADVVRLIEEGATRLLTLTGPGGSGKTRLALQIAGSLLERRRFSGGIFFVNLSTVECEDLVLPAISRSMGLLETPGRPLMDGIADHLRKGEVFLVLDNFEHLIGATDTLAALLSAAPHLFVLVTSREVLRLYGEQVYDLPPLDLPRASPAIPAELAENEAVQLFVQRARAAQPDFRLDVGNAALVAEICIHLDGLPLAIELAAARMAFFSLVQLRDQLNDRLKALRGGPRNAHARQRTLRDTIDWSYNQLNIEEQQLFARLGVFQGLRSVEAVEEVCMNGLYLDALEGMHSLRNKSLLRAATGPDGAPGFTMLETIREYALEKLDEWGESDNLRRRHAGYYLDLVERAQPELEGGGRQVEWLERLERAHSDLQAVLQWALDGGDIELGQRMAGGLSMFWNRRYHFSEWEWWLGRALYYKEIAPPAVVARLLLAQGQCAYFLQVPEAGIQPLQEALEIYRQMADRVNTAWALIDLGIVVGFGEPERYDEAISLAQEGLTVFRERQDTPAIAQSLNILGELTRAHGDYQQAQRYYLESLALAVQMGDRLREHMLNDNLGFIAYHDREYNQAASYFIKALKLVQDIQVKPNIVTTLAFMGGPMGMQGNPERGIQLMAAAEALQREMGFVHQPADQVEVDRYKADLQSQLPEEGFQAAWEAGRALAAKGLELVLAIALEGRIDQP